MAMIVPANSHAQETVTVGSGLPEVEVNLKALDDLGSTRRPSRTLLMPGRPKVEAIIELALPSSEIARGAPRPKPVEERRTASVTRTLELEPLTEEPLLPEELGPPPADLPVPPMVEEAPIKPAIAEPEPMETASLPPAIRLPAGGGQVLRIEFREASTRIPPPAQESLRAVAAAAKESDGRLQLKAFAGGSADTASGARRTSLSRALAVRSFLIEQGVRSTRIDVRALGGANDDGPSERVDVLYIAK